MHVIGEHGLIEQVNWSQQVEAELFIGGKADKVVFFLFFYR
jgi:hypothetical protein